MYKKTVDKCKVNEQSVARDRSSRNLAIKRPFINSVLSKVSARDRAKGSEEKFHHWNVGKCVRARNNQLSYFILYLFYKNANNTKAAKG